MEGSKKTGSEGLTRREALKVSGLALGGLAIGGTVIGSEADKAGAEQECACPDGPTCRWKNPFKAQRYRYFDWLPRFDPYDFDNQKTTIRPLGKNEMRITFMGSCIPPVRRAQQMMSVFVEVGWNAKKGMPLDQFVFDCGSGVCANYGAMNVGFGRMNKIFLAHLHGDHMSDLTHIYCFGPSADRKSPLYVWGPGRSGFTYTDPDKKSSGPYDDGTADFCDALRKACRWHTESFSFQTTSYPNYQVPTQDSWGLPVDPVPVGDDALNDAYALVPIELDWTKYGETPGDNVAYYNKETGVRITHFPVIHTRMGSIGYKLEWNGLSMIYTSDTKPETHCIDQAKNMDENGKARGVDVFIHEMVPPAQVWAMKNEYSTDLPDMNSEVVQDLTTVQNSSHSPQGAFGYILSKIKPRPRLTVATHFPVADDTVACAMKSVQEHCNVYQHKESISGKDAARITWSFDLMVISVTGDQIKEMRGHVSDFGFSPTTNLPSGTPNTPKYWIWGTDSDGNPAKVGNPYAQIDTSTAIPECDDGKCNYRDDGY